jgi:hypothetical protein
MKLKTINLLITMLIVAIFLSSCGKKDETQTTPEMQPEITTQQKDAPAVKTMASEISIDRLKIDYPTLKLTGKPLKAIVFTDNLGDHIVVLTKRVDEKAIKCDDDEYAERFELYAFNYVDKAGKYELIRKVYDFVDRWCDIGGDIMCKFVSSPVVTDLDNDGTAELWIMYKILCTTDVSPATMKLIMQQGKDKYAVRGTTKVNIGEGEFIGGEYELDAAFKNAPKEFREFAVKMWNENYIENWN